MKHFGSLKKMKASSEEEIAAVVGKSKAKLLVEAFKQKPSDAPDSVS